MKKRIRKVLEKLTGDMLWIAESRVLRKILVFTLIFCIVMQTIPNDGLSALAETIGETISETISEVIESIEEATASLENQDSEGENQAPSSGDEEETSEGSSQTQSEEETTETSETGTTSTEEEENQMGTPSEAGKQDETDSTSTPSEADRDKDEKPGTSTSSDADKYLECTCGALPNECGYTIHDPDCPLYDPDKLPECTCGALINDTGITIHEPYCPLYQPERPECTCGALPDENGFTFHEPDCPLYEPLWDGSADVTWYEEAGETSKEYRISTPQELAGLAQLVLGGETFKDKTIYIKKNINLDGAEWTPIGSWDSAAENKPFEGRLIGGGHILLNLTIQQPDMDGLGLFGYNAGEISGVVLKETAIEGADRVGGIAAVNGGEIKDCEVEGSVLGKSRFGDLVGLDLNSMPDYTKLTDVNRLLRESSKEWSEEELERMAPPTFKDFDVEREDGGLLLTAGIDSLQGQELTEYGFVWSLEKKEPTLVENSGIYSVSAADPTDYAYTLPDEDNAVVRAYAVYGEYVVYTGALDADNLIEDGVIHPMVYSSMENGTGPQGETYVYGKGGAFDVPFVSFLTIPAICSYQVYLNREVDPNETLYVAIKGSIVGVPRLYINEKYIGALQSTADQEYYIIPMEGRDLAQGENTVRIKNDLLVPGWLMVNNIQLIFGGGPSNINGVRAQVNDVSFRGYNFHRNVAGYKCTIDGSVDVTNDTGSGLRLITSVNVDGNKMYASQKYLTAPAGNNTLSTVNKCTDGIITTNEGTLTLSAALTVKPPAGSSWAEQEENQIIISIGADTVTYQDNEGPNEFRLKFNYQKNYRNTTEAPLHVDVTAESVFGEPISYICLPESGEVSANSYVSDADEGVDDTGQLKDKTVVPMSRYKRVYGYEAGFDVKTNGAYEFAVVGLCGMEKFVLEITNIDNQKPVVKLVGASEVTILEDTPYTDLGYGALDNRSMEKNLVLRTDNGGMDFEHPEGGRDYTVRCTATDQAGNVGEKTRTIHVKSRPLELTTQAVSKTSSGVVMKGNIRYLGEEAIVERGLVWDLGSAPTTDANMGMYSATYQAGNRDTFSASAPFSSLIPNAVYYCRAYAVTASGKTVYGAAQSFEASDKNYGSFVITKTAVTANPGAAVSLTVSRTGGSDGKQTVRWRTVDGSALNNYHYSSTGGVLTFEEGQTSKNILIRLRTSPTAQYHWELENRVFFVELYSVSGGASLDTTKSVCWVTINDNDNKMNHTDGIQAVGFNEWNVVSKDEPVAYKRYGGKAFGRKDYFNYPSSTGFDLKSYKYWGEHGRVQGQQKLTINMYSSDSGLYVYARKNGGGWDRKAGEYYNRGDGERVEQTGVMDLTGQDYVRAEALSQVRVAWSWVEFKNPRLSLNFTDTDYPTVRQVTALSGDYKADDAIYFGVRFNEIVTVSDQEKLYMNIVLQTGGTQKALYTAGSGTDTLVFRMPVPENSKSSGVTAELVGEERYVKDLAGHLCRSYGSSRLPGVNISSMPYQLSISPETGGNANYHDVTINVSKPAGYQGSGATYQYAFSNSEILDQTAMKQLKPFTSGQTVRLGGGSGDFWLHIMIKDSLGSYRTQRGPYTINNGVPSLQVSSSTTEWTNQPVRLYFSMDDSTYMEEEGKARLTIRYTPDTDGSINESNFPASALQLDLNQVDNGRYYLDMTDNGSYAILATDILSGQTYLTGVNVSCIDQIAPVAAVYKNQTDHNMDGYVYTSVNPSVCGYIEDNESGIASGAYLFSREATAPASGWKVFESGDTLSFLDYFGSGKGESGEWYLHVRARDNAGNETILSHPHAFTVPPKTPPSITVEVEPLSEGRNEFGMTEGAFTPEELTRQSPLPDRLTSRIVWLHVTVRKNEEPGAADIANVMLPGNLMIYDNNTSGSAAYAAGYLVEDTNPESGIIEFRYPADKNAIYRFVAADKGGNASDMNQGTVIVTAIDREAPEIDYRKLDKNGKNLSPNEWVDEVGGVTLQLSFDDMVSPIYGEGDTFLAYNGAGGIEYQILQGGESETGKEWKPYTDGSRITYTVHENDTFLVKVRDRIGNSYVQKISVTNIDTTPPYVDTTNTSYGVAKAPITMQLKYADKEMGLVKVRRFSVTGSTEEPDVWQEYDGGELIIKDPGTWYVHYLAIDDVGHETKGYFGPYVIDNGKPSISIDSRTSDEFTEKDGVITIYHDDKYARMHSAEVTVQYPLSVEEADVAGVAREYQWSQKTSPSPFGWKDAPAADCDGRTAKFTLESWGSEGVSGRWYLHIRTKGTTVYRGFLFDNDLPVITIIGDNPLYLPRGESYTDRGATAVDSQDGTAVVTTEIQEGSEIVDTRYFLTDRPGEHVVTYTATDRSGNTATAHRLVYVYDNIPPALKNFTMDTDEDTRLNLTRKDFEDHYEDDSSQPVPQDDGTYITVSSLTQIKIAALPVHGTLRLDGAAVTLDQEIGADRLDGLTYDPDENYFGDDQFSYTAFDDGMGIRDGNESEEGTINIRIASVNDAPTAENTTAYTDEEIPVTVDVEGLIDDVEDGTNLTVTVGEITVFHAATSNVTDPGTAVVDGKKITYTPALDFNGVASIPYTVTDSEGLTATAVLKVIVNNVNDAPVLGGTLSVSEGPDDDKLYRGGQEVTVSWRPAVDVDNDPVTYTLTMVHGDEVTEIASKLEGSSFTWTLPSISGTVRLQLTAFDGLVYSKDTLVSEEFVVDSVKPEVIEILPEEKDWCNDESVTVTARATDEDCGQPDKTITIQYAVDHSSDGVNYQEGTWSDTGIAEEEGLNRVRVRAVDAAGNISEVRQSPVYRLDRTKPEEFTLTAALDPVKDGTTGMTVGGSTIDDKNARLAVSDMAENAYAYPIGIGGGGGIRPMTQKEAVITTDFCPTPNAASYSGP